MTLTAYAPPVTRLEPHTPSLDAIHAAVMELQEYIRAREPEHAGDQLDKVIVWRDAIGAGLAQYSLGTPGQHGGSFEPPPVSGLAGWDDLTPPDQLTTLTVTSIPTGFFIEFDAPVYPQGGGNAYSIIFRANYSGAGPLPAFSAAAECGRVTERGVILIIAAEPGTQSHFWAQPVSFAEDYNHATPQATPTGGLNGVYTVAGQLSDDHIADLSAGKLTAGQIGVSEHIESTGFVSGSAEGWHIGGNGNAEFNNIVARGTIYATAGLIGGITIAALNLHAGQTAPNTGVGFWLGIDGSTPKFSIGDPSGFFMFWDGTDLQINAQLDGEFPEFSVVIPEGNLVDSHGNGTAIYDTFTTTVTGGAAPLDYQWVLANITSDNTNDPYGIYVDGDDDDATVDIKGFGIDNVVFAKLVVFVTDANSRTCKASVVIGVTHGSPP